MANKIDTGLGALTFTQSTSQLVRTSTGNLYAIFITSSDIRVYKSTDNGSTWAWKDNTRAPFSELTVISAAIDGNNLIHVLYDRIDRAQGAHKLYYITFNTTTDTYGLSEQVNPANNGSITSLAIGIDSLNNPHVAWYDSGSLRYSNRIAGFWKSASVAIVAQANQNIDIQLDQNNVPQISTRNSTTGTTDVYIGNKTDATSFTNKQVSPSGGNNIGSSLAIDSSGNTWLAYLSFTNGILLAKHIKTDAWSTWQTAVSSGYTGKAISAAADQNDIYILYEKLTGGIAYDRYDTINNKWLGEQIIQANTSASTTNLQWHNPSVKWSQYFNNGDTGANNQNQDTIEYLFDDGSTVYYDKLVTAQISVGLAEIKFAAQAGATTTSTSSTSSSTSVSTSTSSTSSSVSTSTSISSTSSSTSKSTSTSSTSQSTSVSTSTSSTSQSTSISTSSTSSSTSRSTSTSSTSASTSISTSSTSQSTSVSTSISSTSSSTTQSFTTSTSSTSSSVSTSSTSQSTSISTSLSTSLSSTSSSTTQSFTTSTSSTSSSVSTSSTSSSVSTSISTSSTSSSRSTSTSSTSQSTSQSTSISSTSQSTSISTSTSSTSNSTSFSTSSTSSSTSKSTSTSSTSQSTTTSLSTSTSTTTVTTTSTSSTSVSTSSTSTSLSTTTTLPLAGDMIPRITIIPDLLGVRV